jgi:hypothetical protein
VKYIRRKQMASLNFMREEAFSTELAAAALGSYVRSIEHKPDHKNVLLANDKTLLEYKNMLRHT